MKYRPARRPDNKGADNTALPVISRIGDEQSLSQFSCPCQFDSLLPVMLSMSILTMQTDLMNRDISVSGSMPGLFYLPCPNSFRILAGTPPIRQSPRNDLVTTAPAATVTLSPRVTPPRIIAPAPIQQLLPMTTGSA